jgi:hypothetical protein
MNDGSGEPRPWAWILILWAGVAFGGLAYLAAHLLI